MKLKILAVLAVFAACGGNQQGTLMLGIKDGPPTSSDGRTIQSLEVDVTRIRLHRADDEKVDAGSTQQGDDDHGGAAEADDSNEVTIFDAAGGAPHTIDLLKVTSFSDLVTTATVPAGKYVGADLAIAAARVVFADAPTVTVPLQLEGDGKRGRSHYSFHFKPAITVAADGTTTAVLDFVPVVTKNQDSTYRLSHDGDHDDSREGHDGDSFHVRGTIASVDAVKGTLTIQGAPAIDISHATIQLNDAASTIAALSAGMQVEVEGHFDPATHVLVAANVEAH